MTRYISGNRGLRIKQVFILKAELPLQEGQKVTITVHVTAENAGRRRGLIDWKGSQEDLDYLIMSDDNGSLEAS